MMHETVAAISGRASPRAMIAWVRNILVPPAQPETPIEAAGRRQANREASAVEMARISDAEATELPALAAAEGKARAHLERLTPGYQDAVRAFDVARTSHARRIADLSYARTLAERRVLVAAEPVIDEFASGLIDLRMEVLRTTIVEEERNELFDSATGKYVSEVWSNRPSILARADAIKAAYDKAIDLKANLDQTNIRERLAALIEDLPDAETMVKIYTPPAYDPPRGWPSYEQCRAEQIGISVEEYRDRVGGTPRGKRARLLRS